MTTWKGQDFEREWHRAMLEWIDGGRVGYGPAWQFKHEEDANWSSICRHPPHSRDKVIEYRWKPKPKRNVTIGYKHDGVIEWKVLVAPEVDAPARNTPFFGIDSYGTPIEIHWTSTVADNIWLSAGNIFLTREDAQAMADWLVKCRRGET
jgi:hypothetical protein